MNKHNFCTLFDSNYLLKGVAMLKSLKRHCSTAHIYVLCMDKNTQEILDKLSLSFVTCVPLVDVENDELLYAKSNRGVAEYCWTLSSCFTWYILQNNKMIDFITYLDADLLFYSSVEPIFNEVGDSSIAIIEHRFTPRLANLEVNGRFCVEWVSFRRDDEGMACLSKWRDQCIEWCYYRLEDNRMGDQKYLDEWPDLYPNCHIIQHIGAGVAPWNYAQYSFSSGSDENILVEGAPLIFYHFHQFQILSNGKFDRLSSFYTDECTEPLSIYSIYETTLKDLLKVVRGIAPGFSSGLKSVSIINMRRFVQNFIPQGMKYALRRVIRL